MDKKIAFMGDSLITGYGVNIKHGWVNMLSSYIDYKIINKGKNGDTTASMLNRFYTDITLNSPDILFIMGGTNDLLCGRSIASIINNIEEMINEAGTIHILIGIPPLIIKEMAEELFIPSTLYTYCQDSLKNLRIQLINLCQKYSITYIDFYSLSKNNLNKEIYLDGIHLNENGNKLMLNEYIKATNL